MYDAACIACVVAAEATHATHITRMHANASSLRVAGDRRPSHVVCGAGTCADLRARTRAVSVVDVGQRGRAMDVARAA